MRMTRRLLFVAALFPVAAAAQKRPLTQADWEDRKSTRLNSSH